MHQEKNKYFRERLAKVSNEKLYALDEYSLKLVKKSEDENHSYDSTKVMAEFKKLKLNV